MEPPSAPGHLYPEIYRCDIQGIPVQFSEDLQLASWVVGFSDDQPQLTVTNLAGGWLAAILWKGAARVDGSDLASCEPEFGSVGLTALSDGSTLEGGPDTVVILAGIFSGESSPEFDGTLDPGVRAMLDSDYFETLDAFLRVVKMHSIRGASERDGWWRTALAVTSVNGPKISAGDGTRQSIGDLTLVSVPKTAGLGFIPKADSQNDDPDDPTLQVAIVLDFFYDKDVGGLPGCTWRCWGP